jgi:hypothetical protein
MVHAIKTRGTRHDRNGLAQPFCNQELRPIAFETAKLAWLASRAPDVVAMIGNALQALAIRAWDAFDRDAYCGARSYLGNAQRRSDLSKPADMPGAERLPGLKA